MKIALIEISNSHSECLYSQIKFIKSKANRHLTLICSESLDKIIDYSDLIDEKFIVKDKMNIIGTIKLRNYLIKKGFEKIIFNTCQGVLIRNLLLLHFPHYMEFIGILHDIAKLKKSKTQQMISKKVKKYFVLNDYLLRHKDKSAPFKIDSIYTIFFPEYKKVNVKKDENELWITIPGQVELKRRHSVLKSPY